MNRRSFLLTLPMLPFVQKLLPKLVEQNVFFYGYAGNSYAAGEVFETTGIRYINRFSESFGDGENTWNGNIFASYGSQRRQG